MNIGLKSSSLVKQRRKSRRKTFYSDTVFVNYITDYILKSVFSPFRIYLTRGRILKGMSRILIPIQFVPPMFEDYYVSEKLNLLFEGYDSWKQEEVIYQTVIRLNKIEFFSF